jgi:hypothetical protein
MNPFRFTILQLFLVTALVALVAGLVSAAWRATTYQSIEHVCFSPSGKYLAASYTSGAVQVWRLDQGRPRVVAKAFGRRPGLFNIDYGSSLRFVSDERLLKTEAIFDPPGVRVRQLELPSRRVTDLTTLDSFPSMPMMQITDGQRLFALDYNSDSIVCCRLDTGKLERSWRIPIPESSLWLSANGRTLATSDPDKKTFVFDPDSDNPPLVLDGGSPLAISANGRFIASHGRKWSEDGYVHDLDAPDNPARLPFQGYSQSALVFTPDNSRLVVADGTKVEYYDLTTKEMIRRVEWDESVPRTYGQCVLSPAADRLARYSDNRIVVYDLPGAGTWHVLGGDWHLLEIIIFTLGFAGWSVAWGIVAKRERLKRMASAPRTAPIGVGSSLPGPATVIIPWKRKFIMACLMFFLSVIVLAALQIMEARSLATAFGQTFSWLGTIFVMATGFVMVFAFISYFKSGPHHLTLLRLKQLTGSPGRLARHGKLTFWFPAYAVGGTAGSSSSALVGRGSPDPAQAQECLGEVLNRAEEVFGRDIEPQKRRIIVCLERQSELDAYFSRHIPLCSLIPRFVLDRVTLICRETALTQLITPRQALKAGLAFSIVVEQTGGFIAGWVATMLNQQVIRDSLRPAEIRSAVRYLKASMAREPHWDPKAVLLRTPRERMRIWLGLEERHEWRDVHAETNLLLTLGEILLGPEAPRDRGEKVLAWLRTIKPKDDAIATFERQVGVSIDALINEWREWLARQTGLPFDPLPADHRSLLYDIALPTIADKRLPIKVRQRMVRQLGSFYVAAAPTLIELLTDPLIELRREAIEGLELLSGETFGDNRPRWQEWWQSVSAAANLVADSSPMSQIVAAAIVDEGPEFGASSQFGAPEFGAGLPTPPTATTEGLPPEGRPAGQPTWHGRETVPQLLFGAALPTPPTASQPPRELKTCWGLMIAAGLVALVVPIALFFVTGPLVFPMFYYSLFLGAAALARGAARDTLGLPRIAKMQIFNLMLCDPINGLAGAIMHFLLRREHVKQYLLIVNAGRL